MGLEAVEIIMEVEERFAIHIPDEVMTDCVTVSDLKNLIVERLVATGRTQTAELDAYVLDELIRIVADGSCNDPLTINSESRWDGEPG